MLKTRWLWFFMLIAMCVGWYCIPTEIMLGNDLIKKVQPGMTQEQVERILGVQPGDYTTAPYKYEPLSFICPPEWKEDCEREHEEWLNGGFEGLTKREWITDEIHVIVGFNNAGRAYSIRTSPIFSTRKPSFYKRIRSWFRQNVWDRIF
jgi:hypothetical protein